jgi:DNA-binding transcriptional LysR family regulator
MNGLKNIPLFVEVARASSFRRAGEALGIPHATVSRRIAELERDIGTPLFNRTTRRVELTDAGKLYFEYCDRIIRETQIAHDAMLHLQAEPSGLVRVSTTADFGAHFVAPILLDFLRRYPQMRVDLDLTQQHVDLIAGSVDVAIRIGEPKASNLVARKLGPFERAYYAAPSYLRARGVPKIPQDLVQHECLSMHNTVWSAQPTSGGETQAVQVTGRIVANNLTVLRQLAVDGGGVFWTAVRMAAADVASGRLVRVLPSWSHVAPDVYALTTTRLLPAKTRVFIDFLTASLSD